MYHLWFEVSARSAASAFMSVVSYPAFASCSSSRMALLRPKSTSPKKAAARATMMPTITEVIQVSLRLVQVILRPSARTSRKNCGSGVRFLGGVCAADEEPPAMAAAVLAARSLMPGALGFLAMEAVLDLLNYRPG